MSCVQARYGRETRRPTGGVVSYSAMNQQTYRPSGEGQERHVDLAHRSEMVPDRYYMQGQQESPLRPLRTWSPGWQEERHLPPPRQPSPGWHEERALADSDTLPIRWRNNVQPVKKEMRYNDRGENKGAKVHFHTAPEHHQRTAEDDDEAEGGSASSSDNSLEGSLTIVEKYESRSEDRNRALSHSFEVIEDGDAGSGDDDGYVHVSRGSPRVSALEREELSRKA